MVLELPYPPSINHYWRHTKAGSHYISSEGKEYRRAVGWIVKSARADERLTERLSVAVQLWPPDKRRRDIDNVLKVLLDSLEHAGVYKDDCQIDRLSITRHEARKGGSCTVSVAPHKSLPDRWALDHVS